MTRQDNQSDFDHIDLNLNENPSSSPLNTPSSFGRPAEEIGIGRDGMELVDERAIAEVEERGVVSTGSDGLGGAELGPGLAREETCITISPPPPDYSPSLPPPPYSPKNRRSNNRRRRRNAFQRPFSRDDDGDSFDGEESSFITKKYHRFALFFIACDISLNFVLLCLLVVMYMSNNNENAASFMIPFTYLLSSMFGRFAFKKRSVPLMLFFCGTFFARLCGDGAVAIYVIANDLPSYYDMSLFTLIFTIPMLGVRGFYESLFPCYNAIASNFDADCISYNNVAGGSEDNMTAVPSLFMIVLLPQLIAGIILLLDTFQMMEEERLGDSEEEEEEEETEIEMVAV